MHPPPSGPPAPDTGGNVSPARVAAELALADMVADTERLGLYDPDPAEVAAALKAARRTSKG